MARTPEGAVLIEIPVSKAPGFQVENVFVMAGIPPILHALFSSLQHRLVGVTPITSRTVDVAMRESSVADGLPRLQAPFHEVVPGSYQFHCNGVFVPRPS